MIEHHTKNKGDLGVLKAQVDMFEKGWIILTPHTEHAPFDIVIYKEGVFKRVQVKYRGAERGALQVTFSTSWADKNGSHTKAYDKSEIDLFCIYCPETDQCYYVDPAQHDRSVTLRFEPPKNNQSKGVHLAENFTNIPN